MIQKDEVIVYAVTDAAIAKMKDLYLSLKVSGLDDEEGFSAVHDGRMVVKGKRIEVEKKRKEYKASSLAWGRKVDGEAKRIFSLLKPIEDYLQGQEDVITKEKERLKAEKERIEKEKIQKRVDALFAVNVVMPFFDVAMLSEAEYMVMLATATEKYQDERDRLEKEQVELKRLREKEEADRKVESERLEKLAKEQAIEAERLAKIQDDIDAKAKILKAEQDKLESDKKDVQARKDLEILEARLAIEAKAKAEKDEIERTALEAKESKEKEEARIAEIERQELLKPDKIKLEQYAIGLTAIIGPAVTSEKAHNIIVFAEGRLAAIAQDIIKQSEEL
jgi:hypothetical protein